MPGRVSRVSVRSGVCASGAVLVALICAGVFGFAGRSAAAQPLMADPLTPSPTPAATPSPTPSVLHCDQVLTFPWNSFGATAYAANQSVVNGLSFTNPTAFTYTGTVFEVQMVGSRPLAALPSISWSWDGSPWRAIGRWHDFTANGTPNFETDKLPGGTIAPGSTHTIRFSVVFAPGSPDNSFNLFAYIEQPGCTVGALGYSNPVLFGLYTAVHSGQTGGTTTTTTTTTASSVPTPTIPAATGTPTVVDSAASSPIAEAPSDDPPSGGGPWTAVGLGAAAVLAAFATRMAVGWWSAGRRLP